VHRLAEVGPGQVVDAQGRGGVAAERAAEGAPAARTEGPQPAERPVVLGAFGRGGPVLVGQGAWGRGCAHGPASQTGVRGDADGGDERVISGRRAGRSEGAGAGEGETPCGA